MHHQWIWAEVRGHYHTLHPGDGHSLSILCTVSNCLYDRLPKGHHGGQVSASCFACQEQSEKPTADVVAVCLRRMFFSFHNPLKRSSWLSAKKITIGYHVCYSSSSV